MRKTRTLSLLASVVAVVAATATTASADTAAPAADSAPAGALAAPAQCTGSWIEVDSPNVGEWITARAKPDAASAAVFQIQEGSVSPCRKLVVGAGYNACGKYDANGWILIQNLGRLGWSGYIPSVCAFDYS